jgi:hypothetical protein
MESNACLRARQEVLSCNRVESRFFSLFVSSLPSASVLSALCTLHSAPLSLSLSLKIHLPPLQLWSSAPSLSFRRFLGSRCSPNTIKYAPTPPQIRSNTCVTAESSRIRQDNANLPIPNFNYLCWRCLLFYAYIRRQRSKNNRRLRWRGRRWHDYLCPCSLFLQSIIQSRHRGISFAFA